MVLGDNIFYGQSFSKVLRSAAERTQNEKGATIFGYYVRDPREYGVVEFDENGKLIPELKALAPTGDRRIGSNPHANGGKLLRDLRLPDFRDYALDVPAPGSVEAQDMVELGGFVRDIFKLNEDSKNFRIFGPDETISNRLQTVIMPTNTAKLRRALYSRLI